MIENVAPKKKREATGELRKLANGYQARVRIDARTRHPFDLDAASEDEAREKTHALSVMARKLRANGRSAKEAIALLTPGASSRANWDPTTAAVDFVCAGKVAPLSLNHIPTFGEHLEAWTSGELARKYPHHVKIKRSAEDDEERAGKYILPVVKDIPIDRFSLDDAERVMETIPAEMSDATRKHVAQIISRACALSVYPCRYRAASPIPKGWLPKSKSKTAKEALYPTEDAALMRGLDSAGKVAVPLLRRLAYGFMDREGSRTDEAVRYQWRDFDLDHGKVSLDENKTDDPRGWDLDPGVHAALLIWKELYCKDAQPDDYVFAEQSVPLNVAHLADQLRADLRRVGVTRPQLFERSESRQPIRAHDLRSTFVTIALATGKSETWVADRTGHRSSAQISGYRRKARTWTALDLGGLAPLDKCIPELTLNRPGLPRELLARVAKLGRRSGFRFPDEQADRTNTRENGSISDPERDGEYLRNAEQGQALGQSSSRADLISALTDAIRKAALENDATALRVAQQALAGLVGDVDGAPAPVTDLASRRSRS